MSWLRAASIERLPGSIIDLWGGLGFSVEGSQRDKEEEEIVPGFTGVPRS